jgi:Uma2 family endonuclease
MTTRLDRRVTAADLDALPHEWDTLYELIGGVLFTSRRPPLDHQVIVTRLVVSLAPVVIAREGVVVAEPGIVWQLDGEDNVAPDAAVILGELPPAGEKLRRCPDIVVEVVSSDP